MLMLSRPLVILALGFLACSARAGSEILINQTTVLDQERPVLAQLTNGTVVAAWESETGAVSSIWFRHFPAMGAIFGTEQLVFQAAGQDQSSPSLAALSDGRFVIGWSRRNGDDSDYSVAIRRYEANGIPMSGTPEQANVLTNGPQFQPQLAALPGAQFVAVWVAQTNGTDQDVFFRRFSVATGAVDPVEVPANRLGIASVGAGEQGSPRVAALRDGGFVIVYEDRETARIFGVRFNAAGAAVDVPGAAGGTKQFLISTNTAFECSDPAVGALTNGGFVVAMTAAASNATTNRLVKARVFSSAGVGGAEFTIGSHAGRWEEPKVVGLPNGEFAVAWQATGEGVDAASGAWSVWAQRFNAAGTPRLAPFMVNQFNTNQQRRVALAPLSNSGYASAWQSFSQDGDRYGVVARAFDPDNEIPGQLFLTRTGTPAQRQFNLNFIGMPGRTHLLQASSNLTSWATVLTTNPPAGTFSYPENGSNVLNRAFRVQTP